jgi:hypothetical protein
MKKMTTTKLIASFILFIFLEASAGNPKYPVSAIPENLKTNVNAVLREDHARFTIVAKNQASYYVHQVITILNDKGKRYAQETIGYDKLSKIKDLTGVIYDAEGNQIKKLKNSEIYDQSSFDGFTLYSDARFKGINLTHGSYPYTVEFEYEVEYKFLFHIPGFAVLGGEKVSVQNSSYELRFPKELEPRYQTFNIQEGPTKGSVENFESLKWTFKDVSAIKIEPHSDPRETLSYITAAPSTFEYDGYGGKMETWDDFGRWVAQLNQNRNVLPEETKVKIQKLTENLSTKEEKVKALYEYMQNKTRYVSIQLGIGGYQPFEASVVDKMGYGDCKALSNYMVSMLQTVGIPAHYVLIRAGRGEDRIASNFPSAQFNHAIVAVPNGKDTLWLECTSQTNPFGYQGSFTGDRKGLLLTDNGAVLANTIKYPAELNLQSRIADVYVQPNGDAKATVKTTYSGLQYENGNLDAYLNNQFDEQKKWIQSNTSIPSFDINSFSVKQVKDKVPSAIVSIDLGLKRYASVSGKRIFLAPNLMNKSTYLPEKVEARKSKVVLRTAYTDIDTIRYHIPEEIYPEYLPEPVKLKSKFGEYEASFKIDQGSLIYIRKNKMYKGEYAPESYQELIDHYKSVNKADNVKMVFLSKT